jgi:hypothetical protein
MISHMQDTATSPMPTSPQTPQQPQTGVPNPQATPAQPTAQTVRPMNFTSTANATAATKTTSNSAPSSKGTMKNTPLFIVLCVAVILAGAGTGLGLNKLNAKSTGETFQGQEIQQVATDSNAIKNGQVFGSANESDFKDSAEGYLEAGGLEGEGSHRLLRAGGVTQTVYLTSSVTDMSKFEGMCVKVWGETFKAQKAGWLMDVGRVKINETKCQAPTE